MWSKSRKFVKSSFFLFRPILHCLVFAGTQGNPAEKVRNSVSIEHLFFPNLLEEKPSEATLEKKTAWKEGKVSSLCRKSHMVGQFFFVYFRKMFWSFGGEDKKL